MAAGGHISGGGYGLLSRLHGVTSDWLTAVDILTVDAHGKVVARRVDQKHDPELFRACRGAGGGGFGVITNYFFEELPKVPQEVITANISFSWPDMTEEKFEAILKTYGNYWETRGKDPGHMGDVYHFRSHASKFGSPGYFDPVLQSRRDVQRPEGAE